FRSDLFYRLNIFPILIPALRERREDIPKLVRYFAQKYCLRLNKKITSISSDSIEVMSSYDWPGNIRELENFIERAVILSRGSELELPLDELQPREELAGMLIAERLTTNRRRPDSIAESRLSKTATLKQAEREHILQVL